MLFILGQILNVLWMAFVVIWLVGSFLTKKRAASSSARWAKGFGLRLVFAVVVVALLNVPGLREWMLALRHQTGIPVIRALRYGGFVVAALGMAFAVWARFQIGRNWGVPMSLRQGHELVTGGPYAIVRHPNYTGLFFALLGSAIFYLSPILLIVTPVCAIYYVWAATREERTMFEQFPDQYPAYRSRTKMLIPFIF